MSAAPSSGEGQASIDRERGPNIASGSRRQRMSCLIAGRTKRHGSNRPEPVKCCINGRLPASRDEFLRHQHVNPVAAVWPIN
jgi:hypothetical protein